MNYIDELIEIWQDEYLKHRGTEYLVVNRGKDRSAMAKLLKHYKAKNPEKTTNDTTADFRSFFGKCLMIKDVWLYQNMTPSLVLMKLNEIRILLNGKLRNSAVWANETTAGEQYFKPLQR